MDVEMTLGAVIAAFFGAAGGYFLARGIAWLVVSSKTAKKPEDIKTLLFSAWFAVVVGLVLMYPNPTEESSVAGVVAGVIAFILTLNNALALGSKKDSKIKISDYAISKSMMIWIAALAAAILLLALVIVFVLEI